MSVCAIHTFAAVLFLVCRMFSKFWLIVEIFSIVFGQLLGRQSSLCYYVWSQWCRLALK